MQAQSRPHKRWRRIKRKYGGFFLLCLGVIFILLLVGGIMYLLGSPEFRVRP